MTLDNSIASQASAEYLAFFDTHPESVLVRDVVVLYGKSDLPERNSTFEVQAYMPAWFSIGDDSGGIAFLMRLDGSPDVYACDHGAIGSIVPELVADSFASWLGSDCPMP
ncbi:hypothetical protein [Rhodopirellula bahusiensis]|uniref:hypothetical protein n=1 Tax=Rhodopirellula bahusiensis TaxID=2014065 RepID=UPI00326767AB